MALLKTGIFWSVVSRTSGYSFSGATRYSYVMRLVKKTVERFPAKAGYGVVTVIAGKVAFFAVAGDGIDPFPFNILLLVLLSSFYPLHYAIAYATMVIPIDLLHFYMFGVFPPGHDILFKGTVMYMAVIIVGRFILAERRAREMAEGRLGVVQLLATNIAGEVGASDIDNPLAISRTDEIFMDSAYELNNSISRTLETVKAVMGPYSCCLFVVEGDRFKLCTAMSPSSGLIPVVPNGKGRNFLSWVFEHRRLLLMSRIGDFRGLGYYKFDEGVKAFLGVPVYGDDQEVVKGILCVDKREDTFTRQDERLLMLAANVAAEYLKNSALLSQMKIEAGEFSAFYSLAKRLNSTLRMEEILDMAIGFSKEIVNNDLAAVALKEDQSIRFVAAEGAGGESLLECVDGQEDGMVRWVVEKAMNFQFPGKRRDRKVLPKLPVPLEKMGSFLCIPLMVRNEVIGVFVAARKEAMDFTPYEVKMLEVLAVHVAVAVSNAGMYGRMEALAVKDGLTGLFNYRYFQERLAKEMERADRYGGKVTLLLLDVDFFKRVNDRYGHPAGDRVLKGISRLLASAVRSVDLAARYGGEEFAVMLVSTDNREAKEIAERIRAAIEEEVFDLEDGNNIHVTASLGMAVFPDDANDKRLLISRADTALYMAKKEGRNRVCLYEEVQARQAHCSDPVLGEDRLSVLTEDDEKTAV